MVQAYDKNNSAKKGTKLIETKIDEYKWAYLITELQNSESELNTRTHEHTQTQKRKKADKRENETKTDRQAGR